MGVGRRVRLRVGGRFSGGGGSEHVLPCWGGGVWVGIRNEFHDDAAAQRERERVR